MQFIVLAPSWPLHLGLHFNIDLWVHFEGQWIHFGIHVSSVFDPDRFNVESTLAPSNVISWLVGLQD